jgi:hypothetical protein
VGTINALPDQFDPPADLLASLGDEDGILFVCNVGDADALVFLLPPDHRGIRRIIIVDAGRADKVPSLIDALKGQAGFPSDNDQPAKRRGTIPIVVATHPHADHIRGLAAVLAGYRDRLAEYWDSGYYHPNNTFHELMKEVEDNRNLIYVQPTAGYRRYIGTAVITVLSPAVALKNRYDSYGVLVNDASISIVIEFPATAVTQHATNRVYEPAAGKQRFVLGADAQTLSWSHVLMDFPELLPSSSPAAQAINAATRYRDLLAAEVLKISHHGSKKGLNLEVIERINPIYAIVSSAVGGAAYNFPHTVAQNLIREARQPIDSDVNAPVRDTDHALGIFYTGDTFGNQGTEAGTIAIVGGPHKLEMWRLLDGSTQPIKLPNLQNARRWNGQITPRRRRWI